MDVDIFLLFDGDGGTDDDDNDNDGDDGDADGDDGELLFGDAVFFLFSDVVDLHDPTRRVDLLGVLRLDILFIHIIKSPNDKLFVEKTQIKEKTLRFHNEYNEHNGVIHSTDAANTILFSVKRIKHRNTNSKQKKGVLYKICLVG